MTMPSLWISDGPNRKFYLIPDARSLPLGTLQIKHGLGSVCNVDPDGARTFEVSEAVAHDWAAEQLPGALSELRASIDEGLADLRSALDERKRAPLVSGSKIDSRATPALMDVIRSMPKVVAQSLSNDPSKLRSASARMNELRHRLADSGIALDDSFTRFPERLSALRTEFEARRRPK